ncbi:MAG TPA: PSD1 and planctomycete cytochrome C domain-containing protein [Pirellulales bacterium]|jgi:hypothetical protein
MEGKSAMILYPRLIIFGLLSLLLSGSFLLDVSRASAEEPAGGEAARLEFFEKKIRPLLIDNCYTCHSADTNSKGGLRVDDRNGLLNGGGRGAAIAPGDPKKSLLILAVSYTDEELKMPPKKQLSPEQIADLRKWIGEGAAWPKVEAPSDLGKPNPEYDALRKNHWAWQPLKIAAPPAVIENAWPRSDVDAFILSALEAKQLKPAPDADRGTLIRRLSFDLTGLPPTPEEVEAFVADTSEGAVAKLVDRLSASPAFGERWGRHWLDVARYGESTGSSRNLPYPQAWRYRDYVIDAVNKDKPYDRFIHEQIAGDLLPPVSPEERRELLTATGFLALGVKDVNQRFKVRFVMDNIDEQIDTVSRSFLGLTASCARCHDHKFDPIPTTDYYALAGIFHSTDLCSGLRNKMGGGGLDYYDSSMLLLPDEPDAKTDPEVTRQLEAAKQAVAEARAALKAVREGTSPDEPGPDGRTKRQVARQHLNKMMAEHAALADPASRSSNVILGAREASKIGDTEIRVRGESEQLGPVAPRGFLSVIHWQDQPQISDGHSGRLELAHWLTDAKNPLTPRVMVNRVWRHLFGQGMVKSVDNFGVKGDLPSHPELLDHLSAQFVRDGWSVKRLVRSIVLSRAYQLSAEATPENLAADPGNRLLWRHSPRRLDAEEIRDATLAAAGKLDRTRPEGSPAQELKVVELRNNGPEARRLETAIAASARRSVYLPLLRGITPRALEVFDFAEQGMVAGNRDTTTVATQALYFLNDVFVRRQSLRLAEQLIGESDLDDAARVDRAYRLTLARPATPREIERATRYIAEFEGAVASARPIANKPAAPKKPSQEQVAAAEEAPAGEKSKPDAASPAAPKTGAAKPPANPDEADQTDDPIVEESVQASSPRAAAWASFCQALVGSAEFRYLK